MRQQQEDRLFIDQVHHDLIQERSNVAMKKQTQIEQSQRDYSSFLSHRQAEPQCNPGTSLRKKNSKLAELNTFKIGGDVREIKKKSNYEDYNESLNLNPTKNYAMPVSSYSSQIQSGIGKNAPNFNILSNIMSNEYAEKPQYKASNEAKSQNNRNGFDQQIKPNYSNPMDTTGASYSGQESYQPYHDTTYIYRPPSENKNTFSQTQGYDNHEGGTQNEYNDHRQVPIQHQEYRPDYQAHNNASKKSNPYSAQVDSNSNSIPEYDQYPHGNINPQNWQQKSDSVNDLEQNFSKMGINNHPSNYPYGDYGAQSQVGYRSNNYGPTPIITPQTTNTRINAKNQSNIQLYDQLPSTIKKEEYPRKEYFPLSKSKQVMTNPCNSLI